MADTVLESHMKEMRQLFATLDRREAHKRSVPILSAMGRDQRVFADIVRKNLALPGYVDAHRINPVIAMEIEKNENFEIIMHVWLPLPDRSADITHQSIHHHGNLLLTSVAAFGPGYESILFKGGYSIDPATEVTRMEIDKFYRNDLHNIEFVEVDVPHVVFYPKALSITYALWSTDKPISSLVSSSKQLGFLRKYKRQAKNVLEMLGLARSLGVNSNHYFDFYIDGGQIIAMKDRVKYAVGGQANFAQNLFHFLQETGFDDRAFIEALPTATPGAAQWKQAWLDGQKIPDLFDPVHLNVAKVNLPRAELMAYMHRVQRAAA